MGGQVMSWYKISEIMPDEVFGNKMKAEYPDFEIGTSTLYDLIVYVPDPDCVGAGEIFSLMYNVRMGFMRHDENWSSFENVEAISHWMFMPDAPEGF